MTLNFPLVFSSLLNTMGPVLQTLAFRSTKSRRVKCILEVGTLWKGSILLINKTQFEISRSIAVLRLAPVHKLCPEVDYKECLSPCQVKEVLMIGEDLGKLNI